MDPAGGCLFSFPFLSPPSFLPLCPLARSADTSWSITYHSRVQW